MIFEVPVFIFYDTCRPQAVAFLYTGDQPIMLVDIYKFPFSDIIPSWKIVKATFYGCENFFYDFIIGEVKKYIMKSQIQFVIALIFLIL